LLPWLTLRDGDDLLINDKWGPEHTVFSYENAWNFEKGRHFFRKWVYFQKRPSLFYAKLLMQRSLEMSPRPLGECKGVGRKFFRGGATEKRPKNSKKRPKIALLSLFQGKGGQRKNGRKIAKKAEKQHYLSSIYYICTMYENPGGHGPLPTLMSVCMTSAPPNSSLITQREAYWCYFSVLVFPLLLPLEIFLSTPLVRTALALICPRRRNIILENQ